MPHPKQVPSYRLHKPSGQARVIVDGKHVYLGPYGSPESRERYAKLIAERFVPGGGPPAPPGPDGHFPDVSVNEVLLRYLEFAAKYYVKEGEPTGEVENIKDAMVPLRTLYGSSRAREFGPRCLKALQQHMIREQDLCRRVINDRIHRVRRIFKWAVSEELIPPTVYHGLCTVSGLRYGRSDARETDPVGPVDDTWVTATLPFLPPVLADMVLFQRLTGIRSGNLVLLRPCEIDCSADIWIYEPLAHKTRHHGKRLRIPIGPQAKAILGKYLDRPTGACCFSPQAVVEWRTEQRRLKPAPRRTPVYPCELQRLARGKAARGRRTRKRPPGDHFTTDSYRRAITHAIEKANKAGPQIPHWFPHQLRHSRATEVRRQFGAEGAQVCLGHSKLNIVEVYAEKNLELGKQIARKTG